MTGGGGALSLHSFGYKVLLRSIRLLKIGFVIISVRFDPAISILSALDSANYLF